MTDAQVIKARGLVVRHGLVVAVAGASLDLVAGTTTGLVGESGSGKTTLARAIMGLTPIKSGSVVVDGRDLVTMTAPERRRWLPPRVQMIFQDPAASLSPRVRIGQLLAEPLRVHGMLDETSRIRQLLEALGLPFDLTGKYPHQISGGQARRVAIARALVLHPRFLIADEPTAGLDVSVQGDFLNLMSSLQKTLGLGTLFISHNLNVVARTTNRLAVMYLGKIVEEGATRSIFAKPSHPYTAALLSATSEIDPLRRKPRIILKGDVASQSGPPSGCRFHTRCPRAMPRCGRDAPELSTVDAVHRVACHFPIA
ncbi:peptide ABC transporter ATP-binding protein [Mesorhizobium hawassense]|uniref:Peptide ABC transporter ATP-binding protein n=1 Tax=Mesorhizobium hawassense TaxID=1209954 RepID=A0A330HYI3_9HYPH|nr:ABC transporter ATP-binding protein [Mesorhizobium hawassense]RAZ91759.1 peptide ABC transporter ATP-binding protein [Mesorhizobium hawassense]